jgi:GntR family transcriptional regulator
MRIVVSNSAGSPLYEQIADQIKAAILTGEVVEGDPLPSVRALARDLRISVITTSRAYAELASEGFVANVQGKGAFVLPVDNALLREQLLRRVEEGMGSALEAARLARLSLAELHEMLDTLASAHAGSPDRVRP